MPVTLCDGCYPMTVPSDRVGRCVECGLVGRFGHVFTADPRDEDFVLDVEGLLIVRKNGHDVIVPGGIFG